MAWAKRYEVPPPGAQFRIEFIESGEAGIIDFTFKALHPDDPEEFWMPRETDRAPKIIVHFGSPNPKTLSFACGAFMVGAGSEDIDFVTCLVCREKYFGAAGVDPEKRYGQTWRTKTFKPPRPP
jgi:hypothetical protein